MQSDHIEIKISLLLLRYFRGLNEADDGGPPLGSDREVVADQGGIEDIQLPFRKKKIS